MQVKSFLIKHKKIIIFIAVIVVILILNSIFGWSAYISDSGLMNMLKKMVDENMPAAVLIYLTFTVVSCIALALPGVTFAIIAGLIFGPFTGTVLCSIGTTLGAMGAFIVGRFFLKDSLEPAVMKNKYLKKWLFDKTGRNQIFVLMITRLVPVFPYNLQNFAYGVTNIKFSLYSLFSLIFMIPGTAMYTIGTVGFADPANRLRYLLTAGAMAAAVIGTGAFLRKKYVTDEDQDKDDSCQQGD